MQNFETLDPLQVSPTVRLDQKQVLPTQITNRLLSTTGSVIRFEDDTTSSITSANTMASGATISASGAFGNTLHFTVGDKDIAFFDYSVQTKINESVGNTCDVYFSVLIDGFYGFLTSILVGSGNANYGTYQGFRRIKFSTINSSYGLPIGAHTARMYALLSNVVGAPTVSVNNAYMNISIFQS